MTSCTTWQEREVNYERIDADMDNDENYSKLFESIVDSSGDLPVDQFYRVIH